MDLGKIRLVGGRIICPSSFGQVLKAVPKDDLYTYKLSQEERIEIAASFLINTVEYITMSVIADNLVVSRSTVINDLSKIKAYIGQGNLKVLSIDFLRICGSCKLTGRIIGNSHCLWI